MMARLLFLWLAGFSAMFVFAADSVRADEVSVYDMLKPSTERHLYWPPPCATDVCVLTGLGGIVRVWEQHVIDNLALGRVFVVKGVCASACAIAAKRARARLLPGAKLVTHQTRPAIWQ